MDKIIEAWNWPDVILFALLAVAGWIVFMNLFSVLDGWRNLAGVYRAERPFTGTRFRGHVRLRTGMRYNGIVTFGANRQGLYISIFFLFRFAHPPLFIPWEDISGTAKRVLWTNVVALQFEKCSFIPFWISRRLADKLCRAGGVQFFSDENM